MRELWELYDKDKNKTGQIIARGTPIPEDFYHIVVHVLSMTPQGKMLITKRHPYKTYGGLWEITGGSAVAGEEIVCAAKRELFEETGLEAEIDELYYLGGGCTSNAFHELFLYISDFKAEDIVLQEGETVDFRIIEVSQAYKMYRRGEFAGMFWRYLEEFYPERFSKFSHQGTRRQVRRWIQK